MSSLTRSSNEKQILRKVYSSEAENSEADALRVTVVATSSTVSPSFSTGANTRPSITNVSATVLAANANRKFAHIWNRTGVSVSLSFISPAVSGQQIRLANNDVYEINNDNLWTGAVFGIRDTGAASVQLEVFEGT